MSDGDDHTSTYGGAGGAGEPPRLSDQLASATDRIQLIIEAAEKAAAGIIEDAEVQARRYLQESRQRADRIADERVRAMSELTDSLVQQAATVKQQSDGLIAALESARGRIESGPPPAAEPPREPGSGTSAPPPRLHSVPPAAPGAPEPGPRPVPPPGAAPGRPPAEPVAPGGGRPGAPTEVPTGAPPHPEVPSGSPFDQRPSGGPAGPPHRGTASDGARLLATQMAVAGSSRAEIEIRLRTDFGVEDAGMIIDEILGPEPH